VGKAPTVEGFESVSWLAKKAAIPQESWSTKRELEMTSSVRRGHPLNSVYYGRSLSQDLSKTYGPVPFTPRPLV
jgi:hypothetical protein